MNFTFRKVNMKVIKFKKIKKLTDHEKLINLIAVQGTKDVNELLQSIVRRIDESKRFTANIR